MSALGHSLRRQVRLATAPELPLLAKAAFKKVSRSRAMRLLVCETTAGVAKFPRSVGPGVAALKGKIVRIGQAAPR